MSGLALHLACAAAGILGLAVLLVCGRLHARALRREADHYRSLADIYRDRWLAQLGKDEVRDGLRDARGEGGR